MDDAQWQSQRGAASARGRGMGEVVVATLQAGMMEVTVTRPVVDSRRKRASVTSEFDSEERGEWGDVDVYAKNECYA